MIGPREAARGPLHRTYMGDQLPVACCCPVGVDHWPYLYALQLEV